MGYGKWAGEVLRSAEFSVFLLPSGGRMAEWSSWKLLWAFDLPIKHAIPYRAMNRSSMEKETGFLLRAFWYKEIWMRYLKLWHMMKNFTRDIEMQSEIWGLYTEGRIKGGISILLIVCNQNQGHILMKTEERQILGAGGNIRLKPTMPSL